MDAETKVAIYRLLCQQRNACLSTLLLCFVAGMCLVSIVAWNWCAVLVEHKRRTTKDEERRKEWQKKKDRYVFWEPPMMSLLALFRWSLCSYIFDIWRSLSLSVFKRRSVEVRQGETRAPCNTSRQGVSVKHYLGSSVLLSLSVGQLGCVLKPNWSWLSIGSSLGD